MEGSLANLPKIVELKKKYKVTYQHILMIMILVGS